MNSRAATWNDTSELLPSSQSMSASSSRSGGDRTPVVPTSPEVDQPTAQESWPCFYPVTRQSDVCPCSRLHSLGGSPSVSHFHRNSGVPRFYFCSPPFGWPPVIVTNLETIMHANWKTPYVRHGGRLVAGLLLTAQLSTAYTLDVGSTGKGATWTRLGVQL